MHRLLWKQLSGSCHSRRREGDGEWGKRGEPDPRLCPSPQRGLPHTHRVLAALSTAPAPQSPRAQHTHPRARGSCPSPSQPPEDPQVLATAPRGSAEAGEMGFLPPPPPTPAWRPRPQPRRDDNYLRGSRCPLASPGSAAPSAERGEQRQRWAGLHPGTGPSLWASPVAGSNTQQSHPEARGCGRATRSDPWSRWECSGLSAQPSLPSFSPGTQDRQVDTRRLPSGQPAHGPQGIHQSTDAGGGDGCA